MDLKTVKAGHIGKLQSSTQIVVKTGSLIESERDNQILRALWHKIKYKCLKNRQNQMLK